MLFTRKTDLDLSEGVPEDVNSIRRSHLLRTACIAAILQISSTSSVHALNDCSPDPNDGDPSTCTGTITVVSGSAVNLTADSADLTNDAAIEGEVGISVWGANTVILNTGSIYGTGGVGSYGILAVQGLDLTNLGTIEGDQFGALIMGPGGYDAIVNNSGTITSTALPDSIGVNFWDQAGTISLTNSGLIEGQNMGIFNGTSTSGLTLVNEVSGTISAYVNNDAPGTGPLAIFSGLTAAAFDDHVTNHGTINGNIYLGDGNDAYTNTGTHNGLIVLSASGGMVVDNSGIIRGDSGAAVYGNGGTVVNSGTLSGGSVGFSHTLDVGVGPRTLTITNTSTGVIEGTGDGDFIGGDPDNSVGILTKGGAGNLVVDNAGLITSPGSAIASMSKVTITNQASGVITGDSNASGVNFAIWTQDDVLRGEVAQPILDGGGLEQVFSLAPGDTSLDDTVTNRGTINGDIMLGYGNDTLTNSSLIDGSVNLGSGDDTLSFHAGGSVTGTIDGGDGSNDILAFHGTQSWMSIAGTYTGFETYQAWGIYGTPFTLGDPNAAPDTDVLELDAQIVAFGHVVNRTNLFMTSDIGQAVLVWNGSIFTNEATVTGQFGALGYGGPVTINNSGTLEGIDFALNPAAETGFGAVLVEGGVVNNTGTMEGDHSGVTFQHGGVLNNSGLVLGNEHGAVFHGPIGGSLVAASVVNSGTISVSGAATPVGGSAVTFFDDLLSAHVTNSGLIEGTLRGVTSVSKTTGLTLVNEAGGTITHTNGDGNGIWTPIYGWSAFAVLDGSGDPVLDGEGNPTFAPWATTDFVDHVTNHGLIEGAVVLGLGDDTLINTGTIDGTTSTYGQVFMGEGHDTLTNSGTITASVGLGLGNDALDNSGTITGDVNTDGPYIGGSIAGVNQEAHSDQAEGNDTLTNSGLIDGDVLLGAGNDYLYLEPGWSIIGATDGGAGRDVIWARSGGTAEYDLDDGFTNFELIVAENLGSGGTALTLGSTALPAGSTSFNLGEGMTILSGDVTNRLDIVRASPTGQAFSVGPNLTFTNQGSGTGQWGAFVGGSGATINNEGTLLGTGTNSFGVLALRGLELNNTGTLEGEQFGALIMGPAAEPGYGAVVTNTGTITATAQVDSIGINFWDSLGSISVINSGLIEGQNMGVFNGNLTSGMTLVNEIGGTISAYVNNDAPGTMPVAVFSGLTPAQTFDDHVTNHGTINGSVYLGYGNDTYTNTGTHNGVAVLSPSGTMVVTNSGTIRNNPGMAVYGNGGTVINSGTLSGGSVGFSHTLDAGVGPRALTITNTSTGVIEGTGDGDFIGGDPDNSVGILTKGGAGPLILDNAGLITSTGSAIASMSKVTITNQAGGVITGDSNASGVNFAIWTQDDVLRGEVAQPILDGGGLEQVFSLAPGDTSLNDTVTNNGTINGDIMLGYGNDVLTNSGLIDGNVDLGSGDDYLYLEDGWSITGTTDGGADHDVIWARASGVSQFDLGGGFANFEEMVAEAQGPGAVMTLGRADQPAGTTALTLAEDLSIYYGSDVVNRMNVTRDGPSGHAVTLFSGATLTNQGTITGNSTGVFLRGDGATLNNSGSITAYRGVWASFTGGTLNNSGSILGIGGGNSSGVAASRGLELNNTGNIEGGQFGALIMGPAAEPGYAAIVNNTGTITSTALTASIGVNFRGPLGSISVTNSDLIEGQSMGVLNSTLTSGMTLVNEVGGTITALGTAIGSLSGLTVTNEVGGVITGDSDASDAAGLTDFAIWTQDDVLRDYLAQPILDGGGNEQPFSIAPGDTSLDDTVTNHGTINGNISLGLGDDTLVNNGYIGSFVDLGAGNDTMTSSGYIDGTLLLGDGNDTLVFVAGSIISEGIAGGDGEDEIFLQGNPDDPEAIVDGSLFEEFENLAVVPGEAVDLVFSGSNPFDEIAIFGSVMLEHLTPLDTDIVIGNGGTINFEGDGHPGFSVGTGNILGNVTFATGSSFDVNISINGAADQLNVGGIVLIENGSTVNVSTLQENPKFAGIKEYTLLTATGGISGAFETITAPSQVIFPLLVHGPHEVFLKVGKLGSIFSPSALSGNQTEIAGLLDGLDPSQGVEVETLIEIFMTLASEKQRQDLLDQMGGASITDVENSSLLTTSDTNFAINSHMNETRRQGPKSAASRCLRDCDSRGYHSYSLAGSQSHQVPFGSGSSWLQAQYSVGATGRSSSFLNPTSANGETSNLQGGFDNWIGSDFLVGMTYGVSRTRDRALTTDISGDADYSHIGAYVAANLPQHFYSNAIITHGFGKMDTRREFEIGDFSFAPEMAVNSKTDSIYLEVGRDMSVLGFKAQPFASLQHTRIDRDPVVEKDVVSLIFDQDISTSLHGSLGVRFDGDLTVFGLKVRPSGHFRLVHEYGNAGLPRPTSVHVSGAGGQDATIFTHPGFENVFVAGGGLEISRADGVRFTLDYNGLYSGEYRIQSMMGRLAWRF